MKKTLAIFVLCFGFSVVAFAQNADDFETTVENGAVTITGFWRTGAMTDVRIPAEIGGLPVKTIGERAFSNSQLTSVTIPNSVTSIGREAFADNPLTSLTIGNSVTTIGGSAFANNRLTRVTIPNSVTSIGWEAFSMGGWEKEGVFLTRVVIGSNVNFGDGELRFGGVFKPADFEKYYDNNNKRAGTYILSGNGWSYRP